MHREGAARGPNASSQKEGARPCCIRRLDLRSASRAGGSGGREPLPPPCPPKEFKRIQTGEDHDAGARSARRPDAAQGGQDTAKGRKKVIAWLKMLENQSAQQRPEDPMGAYDFRWLWRLGVGDERR